MRRAFTLIELLIVVGVIAIVATIIAIVLNPAELLRRSRDANRLTDINALTKAVTLAVAGTSNMFVGTSSIVYTSLSDTSPSCSSLGLPLLPSGWEYRCVPSSTLRNVDGSGWLPINLSALPTGSPFGSLPIDVAQSTSTGLYYAYAVSPSGYQFAAGMESEKHAGISGNAGKDGGRSWNSYENGTRLDVLPLQAIDGARDSDLQGYWPLDEGSGGTANEASGRSGNGNLANGPSWTTSGCAEAGCLSFNGASTYVSVPHSSALEPTTAITVSFWTTASGLENYDTPLIKTSGSGWTDGYGMYYESGAIKFWVRNYSNYRVEAPFSQGALHHVVGTFDGQSLKLYVNGVIRSTVTANTTISSTSAVFLLGKGDPGGLNYHWSGTIDDVRIYARALEAEEVASLYAASR